MLFENIFNLHNDPLTLDLLKFGNPYLDNMNYNYNLYALLKPLQII